MVAIPIAKLRLADQLTQVVGPDSTSLSCAHSFDVDTKASPEVPIRIYLPSPALEKIHARPHRPI